MYPTTARDFRAVAVAWYAESVVKLAEGRARAVEGHRPGFQEVTALAALASAAADIAVLLQDLERRAASGRG